MLNNFLTKYKNIFIVFIFSLVISMLGYATASFFVTGYGDDSIVIGRNLYYLINQGKPFIGYIDSFIVSSFRSPFIIYLISSSLLIITTLLSMKVIFNTLTFNKLEKINNIILIVSSLLTSTFIYNVIIHEHIHIAVTATGTIAVLGIYLTTLNLRFKYLFALLLLTLASGSYLYSVFYAVLTITLQLVNSIYVDNNSKNLRNILKSNYVKRFFKLLLLIIISVICYYIIFKILVKIENIAVYTYWQIGAGVVNSLGMFLHNINSVFKYSIKIFSKRVLIGDANAILNKILFFSFLVSFIFLTIKNSGNTIYLKFLKIFLIIIILLASFSLFDFSIFLDSVKQARRYVMYQALYFPFCFLFMIKYLNIKYLRLLYILPLSIIIIYKNIILLNVYGYDRALSINTQYMYLNRIVIKIQNKINDKEINLKTKYNIYFNETTYTIHNFYLHLSKTGGISTHPYINIITIRSYLHKITGVRSSNVWARNKKTQCKVPAREEIAVDNKRKIIVVGCKEL